MRGGRSTTGPTRSSSPTTAAGSSTASRATMRVLPGSRRRRSATRIEVLLDGGIRRGSDVVKALCLGARAVLIGRAYAYGLGAAGGAGVTRAIDILRTDIVRTLKLLGIESTSALDGSSVDFPSEWRRERSRQE